MAKVKRASSHATLPPIQHGGGIAGHGDMERIVNEATSSISAELMRLVEHAGEVNSQLESELAQIRSAGKSVGKMTTDGTDLQERVANLQMMLDAKTNELSHEEKANVELSAEIKNLNKDLEAERRSRAVRISELQRELDKEKAAHQRVQQALRRVQSIVGNFADL